MANCVNYNCDDLEPHVLNENCGDPILGGGSDMVIFDCDHLVTDFTNGTQILAEIAANRAWIAENVKIGIPLPTPVEIDSLKACGTQTLVNYDRTGTLTDGNVNNFNIVDFYTPLLRGRSIGAMIINECGNPNSKVTLIDDEITFRGGRVLPNNNNELQMFDIIFSWKSKDEPTQINEPVGVFS